MLNKRFFILFFSLLILSSSFAYDPLINAQIKDNNLSDILVNLCKIELAVTQNFTKEGIIKIPSYNSNLVVYFADNNNTLWYTENDSNVFGLEFRNAIIINVEEINNYSITHNISLNDMSLLIENTFLHELSHYFEYSKKYKTPDSVYNLTYDSLTGYFNNFEYYTYLETNYINTVPPVLQSSINWTRVWSLYDNSSYADEIRARLNAVCLTDNGDNYINMVKKSNYTICQLFDYPQTYLETYNLELSHFIEGYYHSFLGLDDTYFTLSDSGKLLGLATSIFASVYEKGIDIVIMLSIVTLILSIIGIINLKIIRKI